MALISVNQEEWRLCFIWQFICLIIDGVDGTFARKAKVEEVLPYMDGKNMDFVIDFASYAIIPAFFFYQAQMVTSTLMPIAIIIILLSSTIYYGKKGMVENDQYFIGFPVLWNFVVFIQFFVFQNNLTLNLISVIIIGILHFVPLRFAYPSRAKRYFWSHIFFTTLSLAAGLVLLLIYPERQNFAEGICILGCVYFIIFAIYETLKKS